MSSVVVRWDFFAHHAKAPIKKQQVLDAVNAWINHNGDAAAMRAAVEQALMSAVPGLRASIQLLPTDVETGYTEERDPL